MKFLRGLAYLLAILGPLVLLFDSKAVFYPSFDWNNNRWLIAYYGEYFWRHFTMPSVLNSMPAVGLTSPMFYGYLLYPLLGLPSIAVGADLAVRLGCLAMVAVQFYALLSAGRTAFGHRGLAYAIAVAAVWSTYSLTNLYNRSAIPEYFATGFLAASVGFAVCAGGESDPTRSAFNVWMMGVMAVLAAGSHPPTAVMGGVCFIGFGVLYARSWFQSGPTISGVGLTASAGIATLGALALAPWVYLNLVIGRRLDTWLVSYPIFIYPERSDSLLGRFSPLPYDWLSTRQGAANVGTPYLEAPIAFSLLIALTWLLVVWIRSRRHAVLAVVETGWTAASRSILPTALGWFVFLVILSLSPVLARQVSVLGPYMQFAYRLASHCNLALLLAVFAAGALALRSGGFVRREQQMDIVAAVCITVAVLGLFSKLNHGSVVAADEPEKEYSLGGDSTALVTKGPPNLIGAYATSGIVRELTAEEAVGATRVAFPVGRSGVDLGLVGAVNIHLEHPDWIITNAEVFPWVRIWVNGRRLSWDELGRRNSSLALYLPAGDSFLQWGWHPDPVWFVLNNLGQAALALIILITLIWTLFRVRAAWKPSHAGITFRSPPRRLCLSSGRGFRIAFGLIFAIWTGLWIGGLFWWPGATRFGFSLNCVHALRHGDFSVVFAILSATAEQPSFKILGLWLAGFVIMLSILIQRPRYLLAWAAAALAAYTCVSVISAGSDQFIVHGRIVGAHLDMYSGPVRLRLEPPVEVLYGSAPLVVAGRANAGDFLNLQRVGPDTFRFNLDHWGTLRTKSQVVTLKEGSVHTVEVLLGSMMPPADSELYRREPRLKALQRRLFVAVDGRVIFDQRRDFYAAAPTEIDFGLNLIGGTTTSATYQGKLLSVDSISPSDFLVRWGE